MKDFLEIPDTSFSSGDIDSSLIRKVSDRIEDEDYLGFLIESNGGFYCHKSIQMYGLSKLDYHNLILVKTIGLESANFIR